MNVPHTLGASFPLFASKTLVTSGHLFPRHHCPYTHYKRYSFDIGPVENMLLEIQLFGKALLNYAGPY